MWADGAARGRRLAASWSARGEPSAPGGSEAQALGGSGKERGGQFSRGKNSCEVFKHPWFFETQQEGQY